MSSEIVETIEIPECFIRLRSDGIIQITYKVGTIIDVDLQERSIPLFNQLCKDKSRPFLFEAMDEVSVTKEGRENSVVMEPRVPSSAYAIVADSLAYKLIANLYFKINKPKKPYRVFNNKEEAIAWLKTFL